MAYTGCVGRGIDEEDILLAQRAAAGEKGAFESIVRRYASGVERFCLSRLGNREDAREAAQDVFLRAWRSLPGFRLGSSLRSWIFAIAANRSRTIYGLGSRRKAAAERLAAEPAPPPPDPEADAILELDAEDLAAALAGLPGRLRDPVELYYMEGLSVAETAEALGIGIEAAKARLFRARAALRKALAGTQPSRPGEGIH
jgi:RNA polymerase sigma-70 factor (ECF subfamily)